MISNIFVPKNPLFYCCEICDYNTCNKKDYNKHINTNKHTSNVFQSQNPKISPKIPTLECLCGKKYKDYSGLWRHKKKCEIINIENTNKTDPGKNEELINYLLKENQEFKSLILEIVKKDNTINNNNNNTISNSIVNSHNKTFNLQFFLNETCKNAMNINEFVDSIKLQLSDLENVAKIGYVEGLSKIIIKNLNDLDVTERPVHCSDSKRDTMYVKDEDKWEKESEDNHKVLKAIEDIANKNSKMVKEWKHKNPECASSKSHKADVYSHIMIQAVCSNNDANNAKILKKIAKEVTIDKS
uniref:C2H2-type domain-containing protein n=1 Tax=viral metagenome TaxID=1070528 RepID=A0A6C0IHI6_9ZZZZ